MVARLALDPFCLLVILVLRGSTKYHSNITSLQMQLFLCCITNVDGNLCNKHTNASLSCSADSLSRVRTLSHFIIRIRRTQFQKRKCKQLWPETRPCQSQIWRLRIQLPKCEAFIFIENWFLTTLRSTRRQTVSSIQKLVSIDRQIQVYIIKICRNAMSMIIIFADSFGLFHFRRVASFGDLHFQPIFRQINDFMSHLLTV